MSIGWGIVGTGGHADRMMAPAIQATEGGRLVAAVSRDETRAREFAERHGAARAYTRYEDLLADPDVQVVLVTTPNAQHSEQVVAAARGGKHVLCDKPLGTSSTDAARAVEECRRAGVKLGIDFQVRHAASSAEARRLIRSGAIGDVVAVQAEHGPGRNPLRGWRTDPALAGLGSVNNIAVHTYDLVRYLLDSEVTEVVAMFDTGQTGDLETLAMATFRFESGPLAFVNANQSVPNFQNDFAVYGSSGRIVGRNLTRHMQEGELRVISGDGEETTTPYSTADCFQRVIADMNQAISEDREPLAGGVDGLRSVQLTEAVAESARQGRLVRPTYELALR
jgi:1,5-anhydro-D-fructose reductase (1,5-anhydro-D-mannitol-forming)